MQVITSVVFEFAFVHAVPEKALSQRKWYQRTYDSLASLTDLTGGRMIANHKSIAAQMTGLLGVELRHQYVLGFKFESAQGDSRWRKIKVKVKLPDKSLKLNVYTRKGYYAPARE